MRLGEQDPTAGGPQAARIECPTCRAQATGRACRRCGCDLAPILGVAISAWRHREQARLLIATGDRVAARAHAAAAQRLHRTDRGADLQALASREPSSPATTDG